MAALGGFGEPEQRQFLARRHARAVPIDLAQIVLRLGEALDAGAEEEFGGPPLVLLDPDALLVELAERVFRIGITGVRADLQIAQRRAVVGIGRHAVDFRLARQDRQRQIVGGPHMKLARRPPPPVHRRLHVAVDAEAVGVHHAQIELRRNVAAIGQRQPHGDRLLVAAAEKGVVGVGGAARFDRRFVGLGGGETRPGERQGDDKGGEDFHGADTNLDMRPIRVDGPADVTAAGLTLPEANCLLRIR